VDGADRPSVLRARLLDRLARRHDRSLTMIIAGAGFGKTTLVRQMLDDPARPASARDVVVSLRPPAPDATALVRVVANELSPGSTDVDLDRLVDLVWSRSPDHVTLVVDDVHLLDQGAATVLRDLHARLPQNGHLMLVGRRAPFDVARRALIDGSADLLDEHDLAFDDDELSAFERLRGPLPASSRTFEPSRWPALLELQRVSGTSGAVQYLVEELVDHLDDDRLAILRRVALHSSVDADIVRAVAAPVGDSGPGWPTLDELHAALPLTAWSDGRDALVIHDLVREALVSGLDEHERRTALDQVAAVLVERGEHASALAIHAELGNVDAIERLARTLVEDLYMRDATPSNRLLLDALRAPLGPHLVLDVLDGVLTLLDHPERARPMLEAAAQQAMAAGDAPLETLCILRLADDAYCAADHASLERHAARLHQLAATGSPSAQRLAFVAEVWRLSLAGRHDVVVALADRVLEHGPGFGLPLDDEIRDFARFTWVIHRAYAGHITDALAAADALRQLPDGLYANRLAGFELIQRWQLGQLTAAVRAEAVRLVDRIEAMGQAALFVEGAATTALFHASVGDVATATSLLERAERLVPLLPPTAWPVHTVAQCRAVLLVMAGDEAAAAATLRATLPERGVAGLPRFVYGATAALSYVLLPETRPVWDDGPCGPDHRLRLQVARALVAVRDDGNLSLAAALPWDDLPRLRAWAYEPHLAELAVAAIEGGTTEAAAVFDELVHDPGCDLGRIAERDATPVARRAAQVLRTVPRRPVQPLRASVLGPMSLWRGARVIDDEIWHRRQRVRDLFGLLAHHRALDRTTLAGLIWPNKAPVAAAGNLRYTINQLLGVIEPWRDPSGPSWYVRTVGQQLRLTTDALLVLDVDEFSSHIAAAKLEDRHGAPGRALDRYRAAIDVYGGPYLADVSDDGWGYLERLSLQGELVAAVQRAVDLLVAASEFDEAERLAATAIEAEPFNESATATMVRVLLERGRIGAARELVRQLLKDLDEVGLDAQSCTVDLAARLGVDRSSTRIA
jgi:DNA-binding SARP family transcriptional activator